MNPTPDHPTVPPRGARRFISACVLAAALLPASLFAAFGLTNSGGFYTVDTGAGLVFKINQANGDLTSLTYNGTQLQDQTKFSGVSSGLGSATVTATTYGTNYIKIACATSTLTHYYMARNGYNHVYLATHITAEPAVGELRYIFRLSTATLPNAPVASDNRNNTGAVESSDVFGLGNGHTRSKFYGNDRAIDLDAVAQGATGSGVGAFMVFGTREKASGGPFFRDIQHQTGAQNEVYNYMNSGHNQTEAFRLGLHGPYALVVTNGSVPSTALDFSWIQSGGLNLAGFVPTTGRGRVILNGLAGRDTAYAYTVAFANANAQHWTAASASNGSAACYNMLPGTYTMTVYKGELGVYTESVTVTAGNPTTLNTRTITGDPSATTPVWRIGNWDGTPLEFRNGQTFALRHPVDSRNQPWGPVTHATGAATNNFPAAQWKTGVNDPTTVTFNLTAGQVAARTVRIGITAAYAGGRPKIQINSWSSTNPTASAQPDSRSLTIGTYRGNNTLYTYAVPASAFVVGANTLTITTISGSSGTTFLSPGFSYDCVDLY